MENHYITSELYLLNNFKDIEFRDNKVYFKTSILDSQDLYFLQFICFIIVVFPIIILLTPDLLGILNIFFDIKTEGIENFIKSILQCRDLVYVLVFIWVTSCFLFSRIAIKVYRVIDSSNQSINLEVYLFNSLCMTKTIDIKNILQIGNNINFYRSKNNDNHHSKTGYSHEHMVTILLNNGKTIDILRLGSNENDYLKSRTIASAIAKSFNIPLILCDEDSYLKIKEKIVEGILVNKIEKYLTTEEIPEFNLVNYLISVFLSAIVIILFFILLYSLANLISDYKVKARTKKRQKTVINSTEFIKNAIKEQYK